MKAKDNENPVALCCAVCGPLTRSELEKFFPERSKKAGAAPYPMLMRAEEQPDLPELKRRYAAMPGLRKVCRAIMTYRTAMAARGGYSQAPPNARNIAAARFALLEDTPDEFVRFYRIYRGINRYGVQPGMEHAEFWDGVLGAAWAGIDELPPSEAKDEVSEMFVNRYMLIPQAGQTNPVDMSRIPYTLRLGYALLRADTNVMPRAGNENTPDSEIHLAHAYWNLWSGHWEAAYKAFHRVFRVSSDLTFQVRRDRSAALLMVAGIAAVRAGAPLRSVEAWIGVARETMISALDPGDANNRQDIGSFFDSMRLWDAAANRRVQMLQMPPYNGPLSYLPLAMGAADIMRKTALALPVDTMANGVYEAYRRGLLLPAAYAAAGLLRVYKLTEHDRERMNEVASAVSFAALFEPAEQGSLPEPQCDNRLFALLEEAMSPEARRLYWDITTDETGGISSIEPRLVEGDSQAAGIALSASSVLDTTVHSAQSAGDAALLGVLLTRREDERGMPLYSRVLAGHPRLRLVRGKRRIPVQVVARKPLLVADKQRHRLMFSLDSNQFTALSEDADGCYSIAEYEPKMQVTLDYLKSGKAVVDMRREDETRWLLHTLQRYFDVRGDLPERLLNIPRSDGALVACVEGTGSTRYRVMLRINHRSYMPELSKPGQGEEVMLLTAADGAKACVRRDLAGELCAASAVRDRCLSLQAAAGAGEDGFEWVAAGREQMLCVLSELAGCAVPVRWLGECTPLEVIDARHAELTLSADAETAGWFELGATLRVDEHAVFSLAQLLGSREGRASRSEFVEVVPGRQYLHVAPTLRRRLQCLSDAVQPVQGRYRLAPAGVPVLLARWGSAAQLPPALRHKAEQMRECRAARPPDALQATLRAYQLEGYRWLLARARVGLGACLADDMGLGKTVQLLALLLESAAAGPSLVVAPLSLCANWLAEAERFAPTLRMRYWAGGGEDEAPAAGEVVVVSYGRLLANIAQFAGVAWNIVALDEAQAIKNPSSKRARAVCRLKAAARVCLTGTPVENSLGDLWSIMHFLNPTLLGPKSLYTSSAHSESAEQMRRLTGPFMLRRTRAEVLPQLPPLTELSLSIELSDDERALYESCRRRAVERVQAGDSAVTLLGELMTLRRLCCHGKLVLPEFAGTSAKMEAMLELVRELRAAGHRALVFSQFTDVLDIAQAELEKEDVAILRLDGRTSANKRRELVELFAAGKAEVFLISLRAGGTGLNLTAADYVILLDPWWNPAVEAQAAGRSHRMGQKRPVTVYRLIARHTVEERVVSLHNAKLLLAESAVGSGSVPLEVLRDILTAEK